MNPRLMQRQRGFTLLELLLAVAIIALLAGLLSPALQTAKQKTYSLMCASNLRQIGLSAMLYAGEHNLTLPTIEPWPGDPVYDTSAGAQTILGALAAYGVTERVLQCPADLKGPDYYAKEGSSYQWVPMASGQKLTGSSNLGAMSGQAALAKIFLAFDYTTVHALTYNVIFADGHVGPAN